MDISPPQTADPFSEPGFRARAHKGLLAEPSQAIFDPRSGRALGPSDWDLSPEFMGDLAVMAPPRPAAVLVPIVLRRRAHGDADPARARYAEPPGPDLVSRRQDRGMRHDPHRLRAAGGTRGDRPHGDFVEPLGYLDSYRTGTGFQISPVVAFVRPGFTVVLDAREVLEVFEVPLAFLMDEANHQKHSREWRGRQRFYYAMPYQGRYIWGATAGMLKNLRERLFQR